LKEEEYIQALLYHDEKKLDKVYQEFTPKIRKYIQQRGGTAEDARDVFQDALMVIYKKAQSKDFNLTSQFSTYLFGICYFIWDRKKKKKTNNTVTILEDNGYTVDGDIESNIIERERHHIFKEQFLKLGTSCQKVLTLFFSKKNMVEIAEILQLKNEHTARNRKYRCQKELEKLIKQDKRYNELRTKP
jgi:RNA polymerase sigma factor (sigma-70 family)